MIILTADKGEAMLVMDRQDYINKAQGLLDDRETYRPIPKDPIPKLRNQLIHILTVNHKDRSTKLHIKDFTLLVPSPSNFMGYQKSIN